LGLEFLKCVQLMAKQQSWGWVSSIILDSFCLKELEELGFSTTFQHEIEGEVSVLGECHGQADHVKK
jgi:hypothetical protein